MNLSATIKELSRQLGPPSPRAAFGTWPSYAWVVRGLTEQGYGVTTAVKQVLAGTGLENNKTAFGSLRAAYYKIRLEEWPAELSNEAAKEEEFE